MADTVVPAGRLSTLLQDMREQGLVHRFTCRPAGMVECEACGAEPAGGTVRLLALYRVEGDDDGREAVVTAVECPRCQARGAIVFPQGPHSSRDEAHVLAELCHT